MGRPKLPDEIKKDIKLTFTMSNQQNEFLNNFTQKGKSIRTILFQLMPKFFNLFVQNNISADFTEDEIEILEIYKEMNQ